jgi:wobble nucleotide-excising tRNase
MLTINVNGTELVFNHEHVKNISELVEFVNEGVAQHNHSVASVKKGEQDLTELDWSMPLLDHEDTTLAILTSEKLTAPEL